MSDKICTICLDLGNHSSKEHQVNLDINPPTSIERENEFLRNTLDLLMNSIADQPEGFFNDSEFVNMATESRLIHCIERLKKESGSVFERARGCKSAQEALERITPRKETEETNQS